MSSPNRTKSVAMRTLFGKCGGCGAKVDALTRGGLPFCPQGTTAPVRDPEGTAEVSRGRSRTTGQSEGPNGSRRGRPISFAVVGTQQLLLWDRLPGSESPGATVRQATAAATGSDPATTIVMEEVVRKENLVKAFEILLLHEDSCPSPDTDDDRSSRSEPPDTDPYVRWCGRAAAARPPPIPIGSEKAALLDRLRGRDLRLECVWT
jgi:hypothetical protein